MRLINDVCVCDRTNRHEIIVFTAEGKLFLAKLKPDCLLSSVFGASPFATVHISV